MMSIPDSIMMGYFRLLTTLESREIREIEDSIKKQKLNPSVAKRKLAKTIIENLYNSKDAAEAEENFDLIFKKKKVPDDVSEYIIDPGKLKTGKVCLVELLVGSGLAKSNSDARRLVTQGGIRIDDKKIDDPTMEFDLDDINKKVIQRGKTS